MTQPNELISRLPSDEPVAQNYRWDERVNGVRRTTYSAALPEVLTDIEVWSDAHINQWLKNRVTHTPLPETFTTANSTPALSGPILSPDGQKQELVRLECLDYAIEENLVRYHDTLIHHVDVLRGRENAEHFTVKEATDSVAAICDALNHSPFARAPRFAAFAQELEKDIEEADWIIRLRDRLGLGHYRPTARFPTRVLALMRYSVEDVVRAAERAGAAHALTVPTVLDSELNEFFFPSPRDLDYGRTLNLADDQTRLAAEVLHMRIDYLPKHVWKVGIVTTSPDRDVKCLREHHLICLQLDSGRDDFGQA
ncbi:hypothetical protein SAMN05421779_102530 [Insolitispirillum peregrinum]|uniref:Uncharacterized protein n=2 Tax=Insolitispirillum peregrinum TaxID=80876 RepID=A0A1N7JZ93_9PROT|nr:hypothetical protein SAMN05421779_102530 [Insolitispirillum peregrinum]